MRRWLPTVLAIIVLAALARLFQIAQRFDPSAPQAQNYQDAGLGDVSIRMAGATVIQRRTGVRQWMLRADRIDFTRAPGGDLEALRQAEFKGITEGVLYREGKPDARFVAREAVYDHAAQRFDIRGGIRIHTAKGGTLISEELIWSDRDEFVRFPSGATGAFGKDRVSAPMLLFAPKRQIVQCPQGADAVYNGHPLHAAVLNWDLDKNRVEMPAPVSGERTNLTFTAQNAVLDLKSQRLTANAAHLRLRMEGSAFEPESFR